MFNNLPETMNKTPSPVINQKTGYEFFVNEKAETNLHIIDFWRWALSNLTSEITRNMLARFLVAAVLKKHSGVRSEGDIFDIKTDTGLKIEVLSASYLQTWNNRGMTSLSLMINPNFRLDGEIPLRLSERLRLVDLLVFCLLHNKNEHTLNPADLAQWTFFVVKADRLEESLADKQSISLSALKKLNPTVCSFETLKRVIENLADD